MKLNDLIEAIEAATAKKARINKMVEQPGDVPRSHADITKARKMLGYKPVTGIREGLAKYLEWYRAMGSEGKMEIISSSY